MDTLACSVLNKTASAGGVLGNRYVREYADGMRRLCCWRASGEHQSVDKTPKATCVAFGGNPNLPVEVSRGGGF